MLQRFYKCYNIRYAVALGLARLVRTGITSHHVEMSYATPKLKPMSQGERELQALDRLFAAVDRQRVGSSDLDLWVSAARGRLSEYREIVHAGRVDSRLASRSLSRGSSRNAAHSASVVIVDNSRVAGTSEGVGR